MTTNTTAFTKRMAKITNAVDAGDVADAAYEAATTEYDALTEAYSAAMGGPVPGSLKALLKRYGPKAAAIFGGPAGGVAAASLLADEGGFSKVKEVFGGLLSVVGIG